MIVRIDSVMVGSEKVWSTKVEPRKLVRFGSAVSQKGNISILLVSQPQYSGKDNTLEFCLESAILLNLGETENLVIIHDDAIINNAESEKKRSGMFPLGNGDEVFLKTIESMPEKIKISGSTILKSVRKVSHGELIYKEKSGKFVETPDNFWVVRVQPRVKNLRYVVYGLPEMHKDYKNIKLKKDMTSYSSFIVNAYGQVDDAIDAIVSAKRLKHG